MVFSCRADSGGGTVPRQARPAEPTYYPGADEDLGATHDAFHRAFEEAKPSISRVPGLQEFAAAIYERRRLIPSSHDPLLQIFDEFDRDSDGILSAPEIAQALRSRSVTINAEQAQWLIDTFEENRTCTLPGTTASATISRPEWSNFIYSLTIADMHANEDPGRKSLDE
jgi:hypothetical protein